MTDYLLAGQDFALSCPVPELEPFRVTDLEHGTAGKAAPFVLDSNHSNLRFESSASSSFPPSLTLVSSTRGWVGNRERLVELYSSAQDFLLKVDGDRGIIISSEGAAIGQEHPGQEVRQLDRDIITGPALVMALALRGIWSLHASAVLRSGKVIAFLGESGQGKSTLAAYLSKEVGWRLVADDILPVKEYPHGIKVLPHFPQLKLPVDSQPGVDLPEMLPLSALCVLAQAEPGQEPGIQPLSSSQAVQAWLGHIAGTRLFQTSLLAKHLEFSTRVGNQVPAYWLVYPRHVNALPLVKEFLETIC